MEVEALFERALALLGSMVKVQVNQRGSFVLFAREICQEHSS